MAMAKSAMHELMGKMFEDIDDRRKQWFDNQLQALKVGGVNVDKKSATMVKFVHYVEELEKGLYFGREDYAVPGRTKRDFTTKPLSFEECWNGGVFRRDWRLPLAIHEFFYSGHFVTINRASSKQASDSAAAKEKGNCLLKNGDFAGARTCYDDAIIQDPWNAALYNNRSLTWSRQGKHEVAMMDAQMARLLEPGNLKARARELQALVKMSETSSDLAPELISFELPEFKRLCGDVISEEFSAVALAATKVWQKCEDKMRRCREMSSRMQV
jgi:tetratricopeptide (TPR) repeat protein